MNTTGFITRLFKSPFKSIFKGNFKSAACDACLARFLGSWVCALLLLVGQTGRAAELTQLSIERAEDGVYLSANVQFELPSVVEDALAKGIPMFFVAEVDVYQNRWYWTDKRVASAARTIRLAFQPLSRRWRVNIASGLVNNSAGLRAALNQNYDTLPEAMAAVQRLSRWRIADNADIEADTQHRLEVYFNLDLSQLPRPLQIGVLGQKDWAVSVRHNQRLQLGVFKLLDKPKPTLSAPAIEAEK